VTFIVGALFIRETKGVRIWDEVGGQAPDLEPSTTPAARTAPAI